MSAMPIADMLSSSSRSNNLCISLGVKGQQSLPTTAECGSRGKHSPRNAPRNSLRRFNQLRRLRDQDQQSSTKINNRRIW